MGIDTERDAERSAEVDEAQRPVLPADAEPHLIGDPRREDELMVAEVPSDRHRSVDRELVGVRVRERGREGDVEADPGSGERTSCTRGPSVTPRVVIRASISRSFVTP